MIIHLLVSGLSSPERHALIVTNSVCLFIFRFLIRYSQLEINGRSLSIISEAVGGTNVDNCPHACIKKPCGPFAECIPNFENYECQCNPSNVQCNKAEELTSQQIDAMVKQHQKPTTTTTTTTAIPQDNRQFGFVSTADAVAGAHAETSRTMKTAAIQNEFTDANNGPSDDAFYKTTIHIATHERKGASGAVAPTTTTYDASEAYSLNNQNDYGGGENDGDDDDDDDDDDYYDYNQDTKDNVAQTDDDGK